MRRYALTSEEPPSEFQFLHFAFRCAGLGFLDFGIPRNIEWKGAETALPPHALVHSTCGVCVLRACVGGWVWVGVSE